MVKTMFTRILSSKPQSERFNVYSYPYFPTKVRKLWGVLNISHGVLKIYCM
jgi:hypothetical protein